MRLEALRDGLARAIAGHIPQDYFKRYVFDVVVRQMTAPGDLGLPQRGPGARRDGAVPDCIIGRPVARDVRGLGLAGTPGRSAEGYGPPAGPADFRTFYGDADVWSLATQGSADGPEDAR